MEALQKLQQIQKILDLLHSTGFLTNENDIINSDSQSHRFLANFIIFLLQPCGGLNFSRKCQLNSDYMPKISDRFPEEAQQSANNEEREGATPILCDVEVVSQSQKTNLAEFAMIGLDSMQRANSTLEDFCRSYLMFHKMDPNEPQSIFRYLPVLSFTESYIYQLDTFNEKLLQSPTDNGPRRIEHNSNAVKFILMVQESNINRVQKCSSTLKNGSFGPLIALLENLGLMTERIREELDFGKEYWGLERKLCGALMNNEEVSVGDVTRAIHLKSFDYRVMNLILYQLRGEKVNEVHMEFLSISEFLVEISDDMFDYEEDVLENSFNILRMFIRLYGSCAPAKLAKFISEAEEKYSCLLKALEPELSENYQKRCEEATQEGGKKSGPLLGTWSIPPLIENEDLYRAEAAARQISSVTDEKYILE